MGREELLQKLGDLHNINDQAKMLRNVLHKYLRGDLKPHIPDGTALENFRASFKNRTKFNDYINEHAINGTWGTYIELILLAELFQVNLKIVYKEHPDNVSYLGNEFFRDQPTLTIQYSSVAKHWTAIVNNIELHNPGAGNCAYYAFAQAITNEAPSIELTPEQESLRLDYGFAMSIALKSSPHLNQVEVLQQQADILAECNKNVGVMVY